jgi:hypothetical protein
VKEKFTANYGEAPDLSWTRAFESHTLRRTENTESPVMIKRFLPLIGQSSIFNLSAIFEISVGRTKRVRTPRRLSRQAKGGVSTAKPCSRASDPGLADRRHCERSEAIHSSAYDGDGLLRR